VKQLAVGLQLCFVPYTVMLCDFSAQWQHWQVGPVILVPVDGLQHPLLHQLAKGLPSVRLQDKAPKTVNSYLHEFGA